MPFINGIGPGEIVIILIIALIVVGPGKLPDVGSALGKSIREFRKAATDVKESTSLDPASTPAPTTPHAPAAPASAPEPVAPVAAAMPVAAALPPASAPVTPAATVAAAAPDAQVTGPDARPVSGEAAGQTATAESWPEELTPADEQQPTPSA